jgi:translation initiation factor IF-1
MHRESIAASGTVSAAMPNTLLGVSLDDGHEVQARPPGGVPIVPGDPVTVEIDSRDLSRGRMTAWAK